MLRQAPAAPKALEAALAQPLRYQQMGSVLRYVHDGLRGTPIKSDARWQSERQISQINQVAASYAAGSPLDLLREALSQYLSPEDLPKSDVGELQTRITGLRTAQRRITVGEVVEIEREEIVAAKQSETKLVVGNEAYTISLGTIQALPNINLLAQKPLERYFMYLGLPLERAVALTSVIMDFRDADNIPGPTSGEDKILIDNRFTIGPRNARIRQWSDVAFLPGFDPAMVNFLRAHFRLDGDDGRVLYSAVEPTLLAALAELTEAQVKQALEYERRKNELNFNQTLEQILGSELAQRWQDVVTDFVPDDLPITITITAISGQTLAATYFPDTKTLRDIHEL